MPAAVAERPVRMGQQQQQPQGEGFMVDNGGLLFKQVTPRRRQDQFGRSQTRHADYLLSMAVFPTGVRTPLLSQLQEKTVHQCGFEVIDKGTERPTRHVWIQDSKPGSRRDSATDSDKKPPPNTPMTVSVKLSDRATHVSQTLSMPPSSTRSSSKDRFRWAKSSTPGTRVSSGTTGGDGKVKDIRDPLYLNTYCPEERKLRYKKTSLPRISSRARPWTVSEANPSYRFARSQDKTSRQMNYRSGKPSWPPGPRHGHFRIDARDVMARAKGRQTEDEEKEEETESVSGSQALLEVKSYFPPAEGIMGDQRDTLKGKEGCLHAKVKQCIKFVKHREKLARSVERPMKQEGGRYRPFSTTTIRTPQMTPTSSPTPRHPDPTSVEIYKEYIDVIALQTRLVSAADKRRRPRQAASGIPRYNTAASNYHDGSSGLQSADSHHPTPSNATSATEKTARPSAEAANTSTASPATAAPVNTAAERGDHSGGSLYGGPDPRGVHQALDIIRLSPKAQPPRSSRTARGNKSYREEEKGEEVGEGEEREEGGESRAKTHAIFLPNVSKSATTSVCSFPDESVVASET